MNKIKYIFLMLTFSLLFASCSRLDTQEGSSVSFKLDSQTVQKIKAAAGEVGGTAASRSARDADNSENSTEKNLFIEVAVHGGYESTVTEAVQEEQTITISDIPFGVEIYIEATAYSQTDNQRQNLYKGHSKSFTVKNSENLVMFIMSKVGAEEESGSSNSGNGNGGSSGGGNGTSGFSITISSGISNGSVSTNVTSAQENDSISITVNPARGYMINTLTVKGADNTAVTVERLNGSRTFIMPAKNVTVSASFKPVPYTLLPAGTDGSAGTSATYANFGMWPQTIKASGVTVDENYNTATTETHGAFTYYKGSDNEWYVSCPEMANSTGYVYSDGTSVGRNGETVKWFKVMPIKWRVITTEYDHDNNGTTEYAHLLLAESILINCAYYSTQSEDGTVFRTIDGEQIYPHNYMYSEVRAYLNGLTHHSKTSSSSAQTELNTYQDLGFLQSAFTETERGFIATTLVDNSADSMVDADNIISLTDESEGFACPITSDKLFLLSERELTTAAYGFKSHGENGNDAGDSDDARIRYSTDYAIAHGSFQRDEGGVWWQRSPDDYYWSSGIHITSTGADHYPEHVGRSYNGVVPAFCVN